MKMYNLQPDSAPARATAMLTCADTWPSAGHTSLKPQSFLWQQSREPGTEASW